MPQNNRLLTDGHRDRTEWNSGAAPEFEVSPLSKQNSDHTTQPAALPIENAEEGSVMENYKD
jgi:hypothetical protein